MSAWSDVCDAWIEELMTSVDGLQDVTDHRYASWSRERLGAVTNERHLAVWPEAEPEVVAGWVAASPPEDLATQKFTILVWEDASEESVRRMDSDEANKDWLDLHEAIRDRLYDLGNRNLGNAQIMDTRYEGTSFGIVGAMRVMETIFAVRVPHAFTS